MITDQLTTMITDEGDAVQFLASVTTASAFENRPLQNPSVEHLIEYALKSEIQTTAKNGAYSGIIGPLLITLTLGYYHNYIYSYRDVAGSIFGRSCWLSY